MHKIPFDWFLTVVDTIKGLAHIGLKPLERTIQSVSKALAEQELEFIGQGHSALHDVQNTVQFLVK